MSQITIRRTLDDNTASSLAANIMRHYYTLQPKSRALVITPRPFSMMQCARKCWLDLSRAISRERANALDSERIIELSKTLANMHQVRFEFDQQEGNSGDLFFVDADNGRLALPPNCRAVYSTDYALITKLLRKPSDQTQHDTVAIVYYPTRRISL